MKYLFRSIIALIFMSYLLPAQSQPKFSGLMFGDLYYNVSQNNSANKDLNGFQFRRIYATADFNISDNFNTRFRLEADQSNNSLTQGNKLGVMVKDAWLQWENIFDGSNLVFGISPTPAFDVAENIWGDRYLEKTMLDYWGVVSSRDFGIDLKGKLQEDGSIKYWIKIGNNNSNGPEINKYKRYYGLLEFHPTKQLTLTAYGDFASHGQVYDPVQRQNLSNNSFVTAVFAGYKEEKISVGAEGFYRSTQNGFTKSALLPLENLNSMGFSLWANLFVDKNFKVVGRYDNFDPNSNLDSDGLSLILLALDYMPVSKVHVSPNVEIKTYQKGGDSDIVPRITFFWEFN